jgi:hypothetical protein
MRGDVRRAGGAAARVVIAAQANDGHTNALHHGRPGAIGLFDRGARVTMVGMVGDRV